MSDRIAAVLILARRPYERAWAWHVRRQYRRGKFRRPADIGCGAVTTRRSDAA